MVPLILVAVLATPPGLAEEDSGLSIMERGAQLFLEGLMKEMEPAIEEFSGLAERIGPAFRSFATEMGPKLEELFEEVQDWSVYEVPEILPNGDIIIRRKPEVKPDPPQDPAPQIEL